ncbi:MAG TPA: hypothetical protein VG015_01625 [Candidatus Dormibacteraeota bacterium]|jgi:hypothetical protein|nr:hypothetical protein [Candidatus Dormibacteraeota bacterium]
MSTQTLDRTTVNGFTGALEEMAWAEERRYLASLARVRVEGCIRTIDQLIEELELMNLSNSKKVPTEWQPKLDNLVPVLPFDYSEQLHAGVSTVRLMDQLFTIQGHLLDLKIGRSQEMAVADAAIEEEMTAWAPIRN